MTTKKKEKANLPNVHFGKVKSRKATKIESSEEDDFDNDEDVPCSADVKSILGFDPDDED
jgi:hypothetical protein